MLVFVWFKIDLIVWKYDNPQQRRLSCYGFKIDLIVWKFDGELRKKIPITGFKIDLIVWKLKIVFAIKGVGSV